MKKGNVLFTNETGRAVDLIIRDLKPSKCVVIADDNTARLCLPPLCNESEAIAGAETIAVRPDDTNKTLEAAATLWEWLSKSGATRSTLVINLGGGMVSDLGGFVASTFKRGMPYINIPTTLLGAVDASVGGKTGINFGMLKNEIGVFSQPVATIAGTRFFNTLPREQLLSGYGEILKHALLNENPAALLNTINYDIASIASNPDEFLPYLRESMSTKLRIVESDPTEHGPRKALNLGHTAGHAFETLCMRRGTPVPHGYAVAWGCVVALVLSRMLEKLPSSILYPVAAFVKENYGRLPITCDDYPTLLELMSHDKKNATHDSIRFTLLQAPGLPVIDRTVSRPDIEAALDIFRDLQP